jgi:1D-myo-inositol-triphosphate 3-kinase
MGCASSRSVLAAPTENGHTIADGTTEIDLLKVRSISSEGLQGSPKPRPWLKTRSNSICSNSSEMTLSRVASGHGGVSILRWISGEFDDDPERPKCIIKDYNEVEASIYKDLAATDDSLLPFVAEFHGEVNPEQLPEDLDGKRYMKLTNLLRDFGSDPCVMDCKLGVRSFVEDEVKNTKLRPDLYAKMMKLDEHDLTEEEHHIQAVTKQRYMTFNDSITMTASFGVRIDGITNCDGKLAKKALKNVKTLADMSECVVKSFLLNHNTEDARAVAKKVRRNLENIRDAFSVSAFARRHSFVGTSLLFIIEKGGPSAAVYIIDFAKICPLPEGVSIDHRSPWVPGNHEDGVLIGLESVIQCWDRVSAHFGNTITTV